MRPVLLVSLGLVVACRGAPAREPTPSEVVVQYFAAVRANDCAAMANLSGGSAAKRLTDLGCEKLLESYREHQLELVQVENEEPDGRNPAAFVVRARMKQNREGKSITTTVMLRVARTGGRLRLVEI